MNINVTQGPDPYPVHVFMEIEGDYPTQYCLSLKDAKRLRDQLDATIDDIISDCCGVQTFGGD